MHYLLDKKFRHSYVPGFGPDWLTEIIVNHSLDPTNKFGSSQIEISELLHLHNHHGSIPLFWNPLRCLQIDIQTLLSLHIGEFQCFQISGGVNYHDAAFLIDSAQLTMICCTVENSWNKLSACTKLINLKWQQSTHHILCVCIYIYIYIYK